MFVNKPQDMMKEYRKASIARGDLEEKAKRLASASAIIQHLKDTLDPSQAPEIAKNLAFIYDFMLAKIADASMQVSAQPIDDALKVFMPIKEAWDSIPQSAIKEAEAKMRANQKHFQHNYDPTKNLVEGAI